MCNYFSCIIDRNFKVHYSKDSASHEEIIKKAGLKDDKLKDRDFVRIEITMPERKFFPPISEWKFKVDEQKTLPEWFSKNQKKAEKLCLAAASSDVSRLMKLRNFKKVKHFIDVEIRKYSFAKPDGKPKKTWKVFYGGTWDAARGAAWDAVRDAVRDAALLSLCLLVEDKLAKKHLEHAKAQMQVWKKGYALLCDVNGVLYVYAKR